MTPQAASYLDEAFDYIQSSSIMKKRVDWKTLYRDALVRATDAQTSADTYPAIRLVLRRLEDHHSFFMEPEVAKRRFQKEVTSVGLLVVFPEGVIVRVDTGSPAEQAGLHIGDTIEAVNGQAIAEFHEANALYRALYAPEVHLTLKRMGQEAAFSVTLHVATYKNKREPQGRRLADAIGYLDLPGFSGSNGDKEYAMPVQCLIREIDQDPVRGWVIDLRRNGGGNMWPMLAGVGPIVVDQDGNGECGAFVMPEEWKNTWGYRDGQTFVTGKRGTTLRRFVDTPYQLKLPSPPVAILTSRLTASSGEFIVLAFRGRPRTCSFGEPTAGVPTANQGKTLSDGARLFLTTALGADRAGNIYDSPVIPDEPVAADWMLFATERDPVQQAAIAWLRKQGV